MSSQPFVLDGGELYTPAPPTAPAEKLITITTMRPGYARTVFTGTCGPDVTPEDIAARFYDKFFGGRGAWVNKGFWGATRHDD